MEKRQLNFNVSRGGIQHRLFARVGDVNSRTVTAKMYSGSEPVAVTSAYIRILRPDGTKIFSPCEVVDDTVSYTFTAAEDVTKGEESEETAEETVETVTTVADLVMGGEYLCEFELHNGDSVMTSPQFAVVCEKLVYDGEGAESSDSYKAYIAALLKLENLSATAEEGDEANVEVADDGTALVMKFTLPRGKKGEPGKDYVLTDADKEVIADAVKNALDGVYVKTSGAKATLYAFTDDGENEAIPYSAGTATAWSIPRRNANGCIISEDPISDNECATKKYVDRNVPVKGVDYLTQAEIDKFLLEYFYYWNADGEAWMPLLSGMLCFETDEDFENWNDKGLEWNEALYGGTGNILIVIGGVPRYIRVGEIIGGEPTYNYMDFKSPMLDSEKEELKAYTDEKVGDIETALDEIIALQEAYIGGDGE